MSGCISQLKNNLFYFRNVITGCLIVFLGLLVSLQVEAQHFFEKSFKVVFANDYENQVAYLQISKMLSLRNN